MAHNRAIGNFLIEVDGQGCWLANEDVDMTGILNQLFERPIYTSGILRKMLPYAHYISAYITTAACNAIEDCVCSAQQAFGTERRN